MALYALDARACLCTRLFGRFLGVPKVTARQSRHISHRSSESRDTTLLHVLATIGPIAKAQTYDSSAAFFKRFGQVNQYNQVDFAWLVWLQNSERARCRRSRRPRCSFRHCLQSNPKRPGPETWPQLLLPITQTKTKSDNRVVLPVGRLYMEKQSSAG